MSVATKTMKASFDPLNFKANSSCATGF